MYRVFLALLFFSFLPAAAAEEDRHEKLFAFLAAAKTQAQGRAMEDEIWRYWLDQAPTARIRALVDKGMNRREAYDYRGAEELFDQVVKAAPDYAEGFNQRAFVRFLRENNTGALADLERAVELEPMHFGAWSGLYHVLIRMGRTKAANAALVRAVEIHPWLKERNLLPPDPDATRPPIKGKEQDL